MLGTVVSQVVHREVKMGTTSGRETEASAQVVVHPGGELVLVMTSGFVMQVGKEGMVTVSIQLARQGDEAMVMMMSGGGTGV